MSLIMWTCSKISMWTCSKIRDSSFLKCEKFGKLVVIIQAKIVSDNMVLFKDQSFLDCEKFDNL